MNSNKKGFTLIEMIFCISVILVILLLVIPNVTSKNRLVKEKSCDAQIEVVNSQIILYRNRSNHHLLEDNRFDSILLV